MKAMKMLGLTSEGLEGETVGRNDETKEQDAIDAR